mgnify:CR=1 FL=1
MNFIIDREGKIIDLANNISDLMSNDQRALGTSLKIQSLLNGLPEIFPLEKSESTKTFRNLVLKKDIGNFGTNPGQHARDEECANRKTDNGCDGKQACLRSSQSEFRADFGEHRTD